MIQPSFFCSYTTNAGGSWNSPQQKIRFKQALVGTNLYCWAAYTDNVTNANLLRPSGPGRSARAGPSSGSHG